MVACSYDWTIGPEGALGSGGAGGQAVGAQASSGATSGGDAAGGDLASGGTAGTTQVDCGRLAQNMDDALAEAKACRQGAPEVCTTGFDDACGCETFVADASSAETSAWLGAIAALEGSGCPLGCGGCPVGPVIGSCILVRGQPACFP